MNEFKFLRGYTGLTLEERIWAMQVMERYYRMRGEYFEWKIGY